MKKVLSVLLAAAMVMGMSVSVFADKAWGVNPEYTAVNTDSVSTLSFKDTMVVYDNQGTRDVVDLNGNGKLEDKYTFQPGDTLYFEIAVDTNQDGIVGDFDGIIDKDWKINVKTNDYISNVKFDVGRGVNATIADAGVKKYVVVTLDATYDEIDNDDLDFYFYIIDTTSSVNATKETSATAEVHHKFDNHIVNWVEFDEINDVDHMSKWVVREDDKGTAIFCFNGDENAYMTVKMVSEEKVVFNYVVDGYDKAIEKAFDYEADYTWYNFKGTKDEFVRTGELFIPAAEETFIYAWDGEKLSEVEAEWVEDYKIGGMDKDGWVIETNVLESYVVSDVEVEIEAEEVEAEVEAEKANPETGAADFVGAAVAMAVVSVAAAGALALKK